MKIPAKVQAASQSLIDMFGGHIKHSGTYKGSDVYALILPEDVTIGLPYAYLYKDGEVEELSGDVALYILNLLN